MSPLLVIHGISLPRAVWRPFIDDLFLGRLDPGAHPLFRRYSSTEGLGPLPDPPRWGTGSVRAFRQGMACGSRAGRGRRATIFHRDRTGRTDELPYSDKQYEVLSDLSRAIVHRYPAITADRIVGHCDIAPGRKTDPGDSFEWPRYREKLHFE